MNKKIIFLVSFLAIIAGFFIFWIYRQSMFSKEILRLEILGPENAAAGNEIEYTVRYKNNGSFVLEQPKLAFNMPEYSLTEDDKTMIIQDLPDIYPGKEDVVKIKTRLLGKEGDLKTAKAALSYVPKNLTARYESDTTLTTKIDSVPITLDFDLPSRIEKGKDVQYLINYYSNVDYPLENLSLRVPMVEGFDFKSSQPASLNNTEWKLQALAKGQGGRVSIRGNVSGEANRILAFGAQLGVWQKGQFVVIKEKTQDAQIIQPLLFISQQVNGSNSYVASPGEDLHYQIFFRNIGSSSFDNLFITAKLNSEALDMSTLRSDDGQIQQGSNTIAWDASASPQLRRLDVQQESSVDFYVKVKSDWNVNNSADSSTSITDEINISQITQKFIIKVNSGLSLSQAAAYKIADIENSGPIPPKAKTPTTYTITWEIKNYFSDAKNVKVKATLPGNVSLTGKIIPSDEASNFSFDSQSRQIVWSAGDILAGTGVRGDPYTISFQISLTPSVSQIGSMAPLIGSAQISGENQFTNTTITNTAKAIDTSLPDDPSSGGAVQ